MEWIIELIEAVLRALTNEPEGGPSRPEQAPTRSLEDILQEVRDRAKRKEAASGSPATPAPRAAPPVVPAPMRQPQPRKRVPPAKAPAREVREERKWAVETVAASTDVRTVGTVAVHPGVAHAETPAAAPRTVGQKPAPAPQGSAAPATGTWQLIEALRTAPPEVKAAVVRQAIIAYEVFGPPRAFRQRASGLLPPCRR